MGLLDELGRVAGEVDYPMPLSWTLKGADGLEKQRVGLLSWRATNVRRSSNSSGRPTK